MLPHPILTDRYATSEGKPQYVDPLFDQGARFYDGIVDWGFLGRGFADRPWLQKRRDARDMMRCYWETMDAFVLPKAVLTALQSVGFTEVKRFTSLGLFSEYVAVKV